MFPLVTLLSPAIEKMGECLRDYILKMMSRVFVVAHINRQGQSGCEWQYMIGSIPMPGFRCPAEVVHNSVITLPD